MHEFKKRFGQNFLKNDEILDRIINSFEVDEGKIIEVGPGAGALTKKLIKKDIPVIAFEIDESLKQYLDKIESNNLTIVYKDFLSVDLNNYINKDEKFYFVSNVPYYITTPIISKFIDDEIIPEVMIMMVQKEVAERLSASEGSREYGAISVILNYFFNIEYLFDVDRTSFYPEPNVDSAVIKLTKKYDRVYLKDFDTFKKIVLDAFSMKRKNLKNNFKEYDLTKIENSLKKYNLSLSNRAEEVNYKVFVDIANNL